MKTIILILVALGLNCGTVFSQNFLEPGKQWVYEYNEYFGPGFTQTIETMTVGTDTVIDGKMYFRVNSTEAHPCVIFHEVEFLREEGSRIYRRSHSEDREFLMIDFAETESYEIPYDVLWVGEGTVDTGMAIIDSFGTESAYDGTPFDVQYMHIINNQSGSDNAVYKVYGGLGFRQYGLLVPDLSTGLCDVSESTGLRCLISGQDTVRFTEHDCFEIVSTTRELISQEIVLHPNPTMGQVQLPKGLEPVRILDLNGRIVDFEYRRPNLTLLHVVPGMYFILMKDEEGKRYSARIFIQ